MFVPVKTKQKVKTILITFFRYDDTNIGARSSNNKLIVKDYTLKKHCYFIDCFS